MRPFAFILIGLLVASAHAAPSARRAIIEGNDLVAKGDWQAAQERYAEAVDADAQSPIAWFNRARAQQEAGEDQEAEASYREAERLAKDPALAGAAAYNRGVMQYSRARSEMMDSPEQALASLRASADNFRRALERNPADADAARNIEVVNRAIRAVEDVMEQMEQERQQRQEMADKLQEMAERQEKEAGESEQQQSPSEQAQQRQDQQELSDETEQARQQAQQAAEQNPQDQASQEAAQKLQEAREAQEQAEQALEEGRPQDAAEKQREAAQRMQEAAERLSQQDQNKGEGEQSKGEKGENAEQQQANAPPEQQPGQEGQQADGPPPDPTERLVEALLDKEQRERENAKNAQRGRLQRMSPVDKDW